MLRLAFNAITKLHSRPAQLRRPGTVDIYSPCRITPSNYFRYLQGPENTVIHGREFIIPKDSMSGQFSQYLDFELGIFDGSFKLKYQSKETTYLTEDSTSSDIQTAMRLLPGLENITVTGDFIVGFTFIFHGFSTAPAVLTVEDSTLVNGDGDPITWLFVNSYTLWSPLIKRGDKIIDTVYGSMTIDEIIEMVDLGGAIMGFRLRCE